MGVETAGMLRLAEVRWGVLAVGPSRVGKLRVLRGIKDGEDLRARRREKEGPGKLGSSAAGRGFGEEGRLIG